MSASNFQGVENLSTLAPTAGSTRKRKRVGIGEGSGNGKTCGKGQKGQKSRSGYSRKAGFEGGQMPIHRRLPKVGFTSRKKVRGDNVFTIVSLDRIAAASLTGVIDVDALVAAGLVNNAGQQVKLLGGAEPKTALNITVNAASKSARAAVEKAGGTVSILGC